MDQRCDILVIGAGPTGLVLANLLGAMGVAVRVIDKDADVFPVPRATHIDEETARNFQLTGLMPLLREHISPFGAMEVIDHRGRTLLTEDVVHAASEHGHKGSYFFDQPAFERILRQGLKRYPNVSLSTSTEALALDNGPRSVTVCTWDTVSQEEHTITARYVVGCDGGRSFTRQSLGIAMQSHGPQKEWMIVDTLLKDPADAALLPSRFQYRVGKGPLKLYAHGFGLNRRWEFRMSEGGKRPSDSEVMDWVGAYIDPSKLQVLRIAPYLQTALVAEKWRKGRVLLAGDAAHLMPPAAGQGMCSGIRDAVNLAWKLHHVLQHPEQQALLDTYEQERKPHLLSVLKGSLFIGDRLDADSSAGRLWKRLQLRAIGQMPLIGHLVRAYLLRPLPFASGFFDGAHGGGRPFPQFTEAGEWSDERLPYGWVLIAPAQRIVPELETRLKEQGIALLDSNDGPFARSLGQWLFRHGAEFALVRPDRVIFCLGQMKDMAHQLDAMEPLNAHPKQMVMAEAAMA